MQPIQTTTPATGADVTAPVNGIAVVSVSLGFFSLVVFWWYPFSLILSSAGLLIGLSCLALGIRGGRHGENLALLGTILCSISFSIIITLMQVLRFVMWDH